MRPLTIERALAEANKAGCTFRLDGSGVAVRGLEKVPAFVGSFLREHREGVFAALGGSEQDRPSLELLQQLGVRLVYCTDDAAAAVAIAEVLADAGDKPVAIDLETAPKPEYATAVPLRLTVRGRPMKVQPRSDDQVGLDAHRSEPRLVQLYGGGPRVAVLDMRRVSWTHNATFELALLVKRGIYPKVQCTMQAAGLLLGVRRRSLAEACGDARWPRRAATLAGRGVRRRSLAEACGDARWPRRAATLAGRGVRRRSLAEACGDARWPRRASSISASPCRRRTSNRTGVRRL